MKIALFLVVALLLSCTSATQVSIKGHVLDKNGEPIAQAKLNIEGNLTSTDENGCFTFIGELQRKGAEIEITHQHFSEYVYSSNFQKGFRDTIISVTLFSIDSEENGRHSGVTVKENWVLNNPCKST